MSDFDETRSRLDVGLSSFVALDLRKRTRKRGRRRLQKNHVFMDVFESGIVTSLFSSWLTIHRVCLCVRQIFRGAGSNQSNDHEPGLPTLGALARE